jgi:hypothetical protein
MIHGLLDRRALSCAFCDSTKQTGLTVANQVWNAADTRDNDWFYHSQGLQENLRGVFDREGREVETGHGRRGLKKVSRPAEMRYVSLFQHECAYNRW